MPGNESAMDGNEGPAPDQPPVESTVYEEMVPEEDRTRFFRWEQTLEHLKDDPTCREAASTLFWQFIYELEDVTDKPRFFTRIHNLLGELSSRKRATLRTPEGRSAVAFVQAHLVTILLMAYTRNLGWGNSDVAEDLMRDAKVAACVLEDEHKVSFKPRIPHEPRQKIELNLAPWDLSMPAEQREIMLEEMRKRSEDREQRHNSTEETRRRSLCAVLGCLNLELFLSRKGKDDVEALEYFAMATAMLCQSRWAETVEGICIEIDPSTSLQQEAVNCRERLSANKSNVRDWKAVASTCWLISQSLTEQGVVSPAMTDERFEVQREDWGDAREYWVGAAVHAHLQASPGEMAAALEAFQGTVHRRRLERDFFDGTWDTMEEKSKRELTQVEIAWHDASRQGGKPTALAGGLAHAFRIELHALIFGRAKEELNGVLQNKKNREELDVHCEEVKELGLRDMAKLLEKAVDKHCLGILPLRDIIEKPPFAEQDTVFLCVELPKYLHRLAYARNALEHPESYPPLTESEIKRLRCEALGIGGQSMMCKLLSIKARVRKSDPGV